MSRAVVVVWLGAASAPAGHEPDLASWAEARQVTVEDLAPDAPLPGVGHDDTVSERIETTLAEALSSGDSDAARGLLNGAEALLRSHADLPESAWLMAELLRTRLSLRIVPEGTDARELERRAEELEGARARAFDPAAGPRAEDAPSRTTAAAEPELWRFGEDGPLPTDEVYVDGALRSEHSVPSGEHHVRIVRREGLVWAGWLDASAVPDLKIPGSSPCSERDLGSVEATPTRVVFRHRVSCPEWAVARSGNGDGIEVARCHGSDCGTFQPWRREWGASFEMPVHRPWPAAKSNSWIFWTATAVVAVAATGVALRQAGAFEKEPETITAIRLQPPGAGKPPQ